MRNKLILSVTILLCLCVSVFSDDNSIDLMMIDNFINCSFWYRKYLPMEYISDYDMLHEMLYEMSSAGDSIGNDSLEDFAAAVNNTENKINNDIGAYIFYLNSMVFERLSNEIVLKDEKMAILNVKYPYEEEVQDLESKYKYSIFKTAIEKHNFPHPYDDSCFYLIDECYSRLIIGLGFDGNSVGTHTTESKTNITDDVKYVVRKGDYLRKIAKIHYGDESEWLRIFEANKNKRYFLPNPKNKDLIYWGPNVQIIIPKLTE